jgi:hypothetical protein
MLGEVEGVSGVRANRGDPRPPASEHRQDGAGRIADEVGEGGLGCPIQPVAVIPVAWRNGVDAAAGRLRGPELPGLDCAFRRHPYRYRTLAS